MGLSVICMDDFGFCPWTLYFSTLIHLLYTFEAPRQDIHHGRAPAKEPKETLTNSRCSGFFLGYLGLKPYVLMAIGSISKMPEVLCLHVIVGQNSKKQLAVWGDGKATGLQFYQVLS